MRISKEQAAESRARKRKLGKIEKMTKDEAFRYCAKNYDTDVFNHATKLELMDGGSISNVYSEISRYEKMYKGGEKSLFRGFYQINRENSWHLRMVSEEYPTALTVFLFMADHMDKFNSLICTYSFFVDGLGISRSTACRAIRYLKEARLIATKKLGSSNMYVLNDYVVWGSSNFNRRKCKFRELLAENTEREDIKRQLRADRIIRGEKAERRGRPKRKTEELHKKGEGLLFEEVPASMFGFKKRMDFIEEEVPVKTSRIRSTDDDGFLSEEDYYYDPFEEEDESFSQEESIDEANEVEDLSPEDPLWKQLYEKREKDAITDSMKSRGSGGKTGFRIHYVASKRSPETSGFARKKSRNAYFSGKKPRGR